MSHLVREESCPRPSAPASPEGISAATANGRVLSLDQYRGYCVVGMLVVNFLGGLAITPSLLAHHNTYFSYADSIMPGFLFAVGVSFRMTMLRRLPRWGRSATYRGYIRRAMGLLLVSLILYGVGRPWEDWSQLDLPAAREFFAQLLKANLWEVLAIIAGTQLLVLPWVARGQAVRWTILLGCVGLHVLLSHAFNFDFVYGRENWLDSYWGAAGTRAWDGGFFGILSWAVPMLAGTFAWDLVDRYRPTAAMVRLLILGGLLMAAGYASSCLTRLYDIPLEAAPLPQFADSPVFPAGQRLQGRSLTGWLTEPPFVPPPTFQQRQWNYWMMSKRVVSAPFILFGTGFAFAAYGLFVLICDQLQITSNLFRLFGQNALAAYIIHHLVLRAVRPLIPVNAPGWYCLLGLGLFGVVTCIFVRYLERENLFLRL